MTRFTTWVNRHNDPRDPWFKPFIYVAVPVWVAVVVSAIFVFTL